MMHRVKRAARRHNTKPYPLSDDLTEDEIAEAEGLLEDADTLPVDNWKPLGEVSRRIVDKIERERGAK
jgi:hypothetical protein